MSLKKQVSIQDVVRRRYTLSPSGSRYLRGVRHDSLVIDKKRNMFFWNSRDLCGGPRDWLTKVEHEPEDRAEEILAMESSLSWKPEEKKIKEGKIYPKLLYTFYELGKNYREYWYKRGFSDETIEYFKLGFTGNAYVIPIMEEGELENFQCRTITPEGKRMWGWAKKSPYLFGAAGGDYVYLTEGPIDAIAMYEIGLPAMSQNGGSGYWNDDWGKKFLQFEKVFILYDNDKAGIKGSKRAARKLSDKAYVLFWPSSFRDRYDVNDLLLDRGAKKAKRFIEKKLVSLALHSSEVDNIDHRIIQNRLEERL